MALLMGIIFATQYYWYVAKVIYRKYKKQSALLCETDCN
ncbi:hypothetical protein O9A_00656 [Bartonella koehlerae C-29]|uniref:Uncharacterized protein n=1 Tax=Bartonella koehlerae C-29 TaxID=1134510 RepID=A0A067W909_9HYPH|nr:hypothetical protein O9A_00656 [Bartonella koehlerae C-29]